MATVRDAIVRAAASPFPVVIEGESGSGKELAARAIHARGARRDKRFCAINCAALVDDLVEAELFGHTRGAFTGAGNERAGLFEDANGGTLFLDEVAELGARVQAKLLRTLQEGEIRRLGESIVRRVDVRMVAATNRPLAARGRGGALSQGPLVSPRRRSASRCHRCESGSKICRCSLRISGARWPRARAARRCSARRRVAALGTYDWPGNVRELQNVLASLLVSAPRGGARRPVGAARARRARRGVRTSRRRSRRAPAIRGALRPRGARARGRPHVGRPRASSGSRGKGWSS